MYIYVYMYILYGNKEGACAAPNKNRLHVVRVHARVPRHLLLTMRTRTRRRACGFR